MPIREDVERLMEKVERLENFQRKVSEDNEKRDALLAEIKEHVEELKKKIPKDKEPKK